MGSLLRTEAAVAAAQEVVVVVMGITTISHPQLTPPPNHNGAAGSVGLHWKSVAGTVIMGTLSFAKVK